MKHGGFSSARTQKKITPSLTSDLKYIPLCVDLDGTLVYLDTLWKQVFTLLQTKPLYFVLFPIWLLRGRAYFKHRMSDFNLLDVTKLPYCHKFKIYLTEEYKKGRPIILATASDMRVARQVADYLGIFSDVIASEKGVNLRGRRKLEVLLKRYGHRGFDYAANDRVDLKIWPHARAAIVVNNTERFVQKVSKVTKVSHFFPRAVQSNY